MTAPGIGPPAVRTDRSDWRQARWLVVVELAAMAAVIAVDKTVHLPFSETPFLLIAAWVALRVRRVGWRSLGLGGGPGGGRALMRSLAWGIAAGLALEGLELFISQPLLIRLLGQPPDLSGFAAIRGNTKLLLLGLALIWSMAAFGEEMVWRGYLMNRVADLGNRTRAAWAVSLVVVNIAFGFGHAYQGVTGIIDEGLMGALLGALYLACGRRLAVPIIAHGVQDTVDIVLVFLGAYPTG